VAAPRHEPIRTCVGCRTAEPKGRLIRLVGTAAGIRVDRDGTAPGRGAYLHGRADCVDAALRRGGLARALRTALTAREASTLRADIEGAWST
jgi:predicted RNA-binding protein YlxR (DUF448 family)